MLGIPAEATPWEQFWRNRISEEIVDKFMVTRYSIYTHEDIVGPPVVAEIAEYIKKKAIKFATIYI